MSNCMRFVKLDEGNYLNVGQVTRVSASPDGRQVAVELSNGREIIFHNTTLAEVMMTLGFSL